MRMRGLMDGGVSEVVVSDVVKGRGAAVLVVFVDVWGERRREVLLMCVRARVRAPAMAVVGVRVEGEVVERRWVRHLRRVVRIWWKGR